MHRKAKGTPSASLVGAASQQEFITQAATALTRTDLLKSLQRLATGSPHQSSRDRATTCVVTVNALRS
jgi:hypothetical protein